MLEAIKKILLAANVASSIFNLFNSNVKKQ